MAEINSEAYKKFLASAPIEQREFRTIELYHPSFLSILRFVQDTQDQTLTLEATAPRDPSLPTVFTAISMVIEEPQETQDADPVLTVNLGGVGAEVQDQVDLIIGEEVLTPIECIYRKFYSGDLSAPVVVLSLSVSTIRFEGYTKVAFTAEDIDFANKISGELYTIERFPMLAGV